MDGQVENSLARQYVENQLSLDVARDFPFAGADQYSQRPAGAKFRQHIERFLFSKNRSNRWLVMPGLRGVGKTTLVLQLCKWLREEHGRRAPHTLYVSADTVLELGSSLSEVLRIYESILGDRFSRIKAPVFIFIDEIQADQNWAQTIKTIYDSSDNTFFVCTGSSATHLQLTADVEGRRAKVEKLFPLSFVEYQQLGSGIEPNQSLGRTISDVLHYSRDGAAVIKGLKAVEPDVRQRWVHYNRRSLDNYLKIGTMPLAFDKDIKDVYGNLKKSINTVVGGDLRSHGRNFNANSILTAQKLLVHLATSSDTLTFDKLSRLLRANYAQLDSIFNALVQAELLIKVPAYGKSTHNSKRPVRYNFMSPALRYAYFDIVGSRSVAGRRRGSLLEDIVSLYYYRDFAFEMKGELTYYYDSVGKKQCDFVLKLPDDTNIALEFGLGKKDAGQVQAAMAKINNCKYGLVFSQTGLRLQGNSIAFVPLDYFFLL